MVIKFIKNWFKPKEMLKLELLEAITQPIKSEPKQYYCDVCKQPAKHIALVESDTGPHVIGAKCDDHIAMVIRTMRDEEYTGTRLQHSEPVHFAGFKSEPYSEWFECSCPKGTTHYILSSDSRLLGKKPRPKLGEGVKK